MTRITGRVVADEGYFDAARRVANWRPSVLAYCAPLSALTLNEGYRQRRRLRLGPGARRRRARSPSGCAPPAYASRTRRPAASRPDTATLVYTERSARLERVLATMNKPSDNFLAEQLLKGLGAGFGAGGTTAAGADVAERFLQSASASKAASASATGPASATGTG